MSPELIKTLGISIIESKYLVIKKEDWSKCRSKARAKRRHARGIKTNMVMTEEPTSMIIGSDFYCHPVIYQALMRVIKK